MPMEETSVQWHSQVAAGCPGGSPAPPWTGQGAPAPEPRRDDGRSAPPQEEYPHWALPRWGCPRWERPRWGHPHSFPRCRRRQSRPTRRCRRHGHLRWQEWPTAHQPTAPDLCGRRGQIQSATATARTRRTARRSLQRTPLTVAAAAAATKQTNQLRRAPAAHMPAHLRAAQTDLPEKKGGGVPLAGPCRVAPRLAGCQATPPARRGDPQMSVVARARVAARRSRSCWGRRGESLKGQNPPRSVMPAQTQCRGRRWDHHPNAQAAPPGPG